MIKQNTPEWLKLRQSKIGASDAPAILGKSPWKTAKQLWEEKLGLRALPQKNEAMMRGIEQEPLALAAYNAHTGKDASPEVVFHPEHKWMMASLDGLSLDRLTIVEIKTAGRDDHNTAANGSVPEKYYPQLQHQLAVMNLNVLHYFSWNNGEFHLVEVQRDDKFIEMMIAKEVEFWECVQNFKEPELSDRDYVVREDTNWLTETDLWSSLNEKEKEIKAAKDSCRKRLIALAGDNSCRGGGVEVRKTAGKGRIDYSAIPVDLVNLEEYRKPPVNSWRVAATKR